MVFGQSIVEWLAESSNVYVFLSLLDFQEGFDFHHAERNYLMLVRWIAETTNSLPANASHRVGIGAFVMNSNREVLSKLIDPRNNTLFLGIMNRRSTRSLM